MLAYATALDLPGGLLAYAEAEEQPVEHEVRNAGKRLEVAAVNLSGSIADIRASIDELAQRVRTLRGHSPPSSSRSLTGLTQTGPAYIHTAQG